MSKTLRQLLSESKDGKVRKSCSDHEFLFIGFSGEDRVVLQDLYNDCLFYENINSLEYELVVSKKKIKKFIMKNHNDSRFPYFECYFESRKEAEDSQDNFKIVAEFDECIEVEE